MNILKSCTVIVSITVATALQASTYRTLNIPEKENEKVTKLILTGTDLSVRKLELRKFPNLRELDLSNTNLTRIDSEDIKWFGQLESLNLSDNPLLDLVAMLKLYPEKNKLKSLTARSNALLYLPMEVKVLTQLEVLDMSDNMLMYMPEHIKYLKALRHINLANNQLRTLPFGLMSCQKLEFLSVSGNIGISPESIVEVLNYVPVMEQVDISETARIPINVGLLKTKELIANNIASAEIPETMKDNEWLRSLSLSSVSGGLSLETLEAITALQHLEFLQLEWNKLKSARILISMTGLKVLNISNNELSPTKIDELRSSLENTDVIAGDQKFVSPEFKVDPPFDFLTIEAEQRTIKGSKGTKLVFESGTEIDIPAKSVLNANGEPYTGTITVKLKEYDDALEAFASGIPMSFEKDGEQVMMASAGMFDFQVEDESGNPLTIKPNVIEVRKTASSMDEDFAKWRMNDSLWELMPNYVDTRFNGQFINPFPYRVAGIGKAPQLRVPDIYMNRLEMKVKARRSKEQIEIQFQDLKQTFALRARKKKWQHAKDLTSSTWVWKGSDYDSTFRKLKKLERRVKYVNRGARRNIDRKGLHSHTSTIILNDAWLSADSESGDVFWLNLKVLEDTICLEVLPKVDIKDAYALQREMADIFIAMDKHRTKSHEKWQALDAAIDQETKAHEEKLKGYEEKARAAIKKRNPYTISKFRAFRLLATGACNIDRIMKVEEATDPMLAKTVDDSGKQLKYEKIYILDSRNNTVSTYRTNQTPRFSKTGVNAAIAVLKDNKLAYCKPEDFDNKTFGKYGSKLMLNVVDEHINIDQLRAMLYD